MSPAKPQYFENDLAEWELHTDNGLIADLEAWLERYIEDREANGVAAKTVTSYRQAIALFIEYSQQYDTVLEFDGITAKYINNYLMWYQNKLAQNGFVSPEDLAVVRSNTPNKMGRNDAGLKVAYPFEKSLSHRSTVLKQFLAFVSGNNKEQHDFTKQFKWIAKIEVKKRPTQYLTMSELDELIAFMQEWPNIHKEYRKGSVQNAYKDALIVLLYCYTGARSDEVISLTLRDITEDRLKDEDGKTQKFYIISFINTKGGDPRTTAVPKEDIEKFVDFLKSSLPDDSYYISSPHVKGKYENRKMTDSTMYRFVTWALHNMGIQKSGRHIIRRGYITKRIAEGKDIASVAQEVGHESTETTYKFYLKNNPELMMQQKMKTKTKR